MPIVFLFGRMEGTKTLLGDCDTGWHIRTGEWILAHHQVPAHDVFSFSKPGEPWFAWEWLSDIIFALLNQFGGLQAVVLFSVLLIAATFGSLYLLTRRNSSPLVAIVVTLLAVAASSVHWLARPHLFTLFFLVLFYAGLELVREGRSRIAGVPILAVFPVLTAIWTNLHGAFFVGAMTIGAYGCGSLLRGVLGTDPAERPELWRAARNYFASAGACILASLINPYTYHLHVHMVQFLRDPWSAQHILEYFSLSFHHPAARFFEVMLALTVLAGVAQIRQGNYTPLVLMGIWAHGGLLASRNIPLFAIVAAPPVAEAVQEWLLALPGRSVAGWLRGAAARLNQIIAETAETDALPRWHVASVLGAGLLAAILFAPNPPKRFRSEFDPKDYPAAAIKVVQAKFPGARIFTHDEWGDYLIYTNNKAFVDGRNDFYGDDFENKYIDVMNVKYDWEQILGKFSVDTILLPPSAPLTGALKESTRWRVAYDDGVALVFRSVTASVGESRSVAAKSGGSGRDREVTKTEARDHHAITQDKPSKT
jgi:hypothetical protein